MSGKRAAVEIGVVVLLLLLVTAGVLFAARSGARYLTELVPVEVDRALGEQSARVVEMTSKVCPNDAAVKYVKEIAAPLIAAAGDDRFSFRFVVVESPEVNAFALPGGFVTVDSALLESARSGEEVAAVLAHEMQHVLRRHGTERMLRELGGTVLLSAIFGGTGIAVPAGTVHDFLSNAYDRAQESEADERGLALLVKAGIDPTGMATFFERLARSTLTPPAILSNHPDPGDRAEKARRAAAGAHVTRKLPSPAGIRCEG